MRVWRFAVVPFRAVLAAVFLFATVFLVLTFLTAVFFAVAFVRREDVEARAASEGLDGLVELVMCRFRGSRSKKR